MSPRRMDISSLLRAPSPSPSDRPRTIDALLHHPQPSDHPPPSLLAILNSPRPLYATQPTHPAGHPHPHPHPQFLGLDALVHVASEEHRRISAVSSPTERDLNRDRFTERDHPTGRPQWDSFAHDHDRSSRHYTYPFPPPFQDNSRLHKRPREAAPPSPPRSTSPEPRIISGPLSSPSTRHHPSASPTNNYPTLRRHPIETTRSSPALSVGPVNDTRTIARSPSVSLQHTSPFLHSLHPSQLPIHSSPRNNSPHRHSPPYLRSHPHLFLVQTGPLTPASAQADTMSPRYGYGPRMAGGIEVLSNDPSSTRDSPRHDLANYQSPGRDVSMERLVSESRAEHSRHEPPKLSPLPGRPFFLDDDRQMKAFPYQIDGQESVLLRERVRSHPPRSPPPVASTDKSMGILAKEAGFPTHPPPERHPIRVWEQQPASRETSRRISLVHMPDILCGPTEAHPGSGAGESEHNERPARDNWETVLRQDVAEDVPTPPLSTEASSPRVPTLEPLASDLPTSSEGTPIDLPPSSPTPMQSRSLVQSEPQVHFLHTSLLNSPTSRTPASPVLDLHLKNFETQSEFQLERADTRVDASTSIPLTSSDSIITQPLLDKVGLMPEVTEMDDVLMANPLPHQPSPQPVLLKEPRTFETLTLSTHPNVSQSTSRSPSQQPLPTLSPAKDEYNTPPEEILISPPTQPALHSRRYPEPECTSLREPLVSEQIMVDVDEELLRLVEDRPVRPVPAMPKAQTELRFPPSTMAIQAIGASTEQGSREASNGPSLAPSFHPAPKGPPSMTDDKDRGSMPPPTARSKKAEKDKATSTAGTATGSKKKRDGVSKPAAKPKQPPKPRAKPVPKPKARPNAADTSKGSIPKGALNPNIRSRSTSVIPVAVDDVVPEPEAGESDREDDKLYCICKTRYDEDRMMIACDRCDEWFHTLCVNMPDLEIDLVDQFVCPPCIQKNPHLRTTWKRRCLFGLQHKDPSSPEACHKPSRGAFSKYCSDDCGIKYMRVHIAHWEKSGGARGLLWENVKNAAKREGVVVCAETTMANLPRTIDVDANNSGRKPSDSAVQRRAEREVTRLNVRLEDVVKEREFMKRELDIVVWREKVVELASERAGKVDECGWDQRLCFGKEEWADFGLEVLESYEEDRVKVESGDDVMLLDTAPTIHGEWWCTGKKKCERHAGWQKLRAAEVSFDKETKEGILLKLTTCEREIRKRIEDILYPQPMGVLQTLSAPPRSEIQLNGAEKSRSTGRVSERGSKRSL